MPNIFRKSNFPLFILAAVILLAGFLRFYRISEYLTFLGDEGRDVLVVKRMLVDGKLTLLGPITSVGSIYMGPIFYYLMAPFLFLWKFDPTGPAVMVALFSLATVYLVFRIGRDFLDTWVGLAAAFFYAMAVLPIQLSHFFATDTFLNLFMFASFYFALRFNIFFCSWFL